MIELQPAGVKCTPGTWKKWCPGSGYRLFVGCPKCGTVAQLDHQVATDGTVTPSVVCPKDGCDFHDMVKLQNWPGGK